MIAQRHLLKFVRACAQMENPAAARHALKLSLNGSIAAADDLLSVPELVKRVEEAREAKKSKANENPERDPRRVALAKKHYESRLPTVAKFQAAFDRHLEYAKHETLRNVEQYFQANKSTPIKSAEGVPGGVAADLVFDQDVFADGLFAALRNESEDALQTAGDQLYAELGRDDVWSMPEPKALQFLEQRKLKLADIPDKIAKEIRAEINNGLNDGESNAQMSKRLSEKFDDISKSRGATMADSETGAAFGVARHEAMDSVGTSEHGWLTSHLPNVRCAHAMAEADPRNQGIPLDQPFHVGGELLRYPCDENGAPENTMNCHCVETAGNLWDSLLKEAA